MLARFLPTVFVLLLFAVGNSTKAQNTEDGLNIRAGDHGIQSVAADATASTISMVAGAIAGFVGGFGAVIPDGLAGALVATTLKEAGLAVHAALDCVPAAATGGTHPTAASNQCLRPDPTVDEGGR